MSAVPGGFLLRKMEGHSGVEFTNWAGGVFTAKTSHTKDNFTFGNNEAMGKQFPKHTVLKRKKHEQTNEDNTLSRFAIVTHGSIPGYTTV